jgi:hypothetical protein
MGGVSVQLSAVSGAPSSPPTLLVAPAGSAPAARSNPEAALQGKARDSPAGGLSGAAALAATAEAVAALLEQSSRGEEVVLGRCHTYKKKQRRCSSLGQRPGGGR